MALDTSRSIQGLYVGLINPYPDHFTKRPAANLVGDPPLIEIFNRGYWGTTLDMENIERAMLDVRIGIMHRAMDMIREAMWHNPPVRGMVFRRVAQVAAAPYDVQVPSDIEAGDLKWAKKIAAMVRRMYRGATGTRGPKNSSSFRDTLKQLMAAVVDGRSVTQSNFVPVSGDPDAKYQLVGFSWVHPSRIAYGPNRELRVVERHIQTGMYNPVGPPLDELPHRFITHRPQLFADYPEYDGLWISMLYYLFFHRYAWRQKMQFIEKFIKGWRKITAPGGLETHITQPSIEEAAERAEELGGETNVWWGAPGIDLQMEWPAGSGYQLIDTMPGDVESALAKLILGQDKTTTGDTYGKGAEELKGESLLIAQDDAATLEQTIDRFSEQLVALNVSPNATHLAPKFKLQITNETSPDAIQRVFSQAIIDGVRIPEKLYREKTHIRAPEEDEAYVVADPSKPGQGVTIDPTKGEHERDLIQEVVAPNVIAEATVPHDLEEEMIGCCRRSFIKKMGEWASAYTAACDGVDDWKTIKQRLDDTHEAFDFEDTAWPIEELIVRGQMIGVLSAIEDAENEDAAVALPVHADDVMLDARTLRGLSGDLVRKPYSEAVRAFAARKAIPRATFDKLRGEAKREAFTIAGLATKRQLELAKKEVAKAIEEGTLPSTFTKRLAAKFTAAGMTALSTSHSEIVLRNAAMTAIADGRWAQLTQPEVLAARPYWQVRGVEAGARETHRVNHGKVVRADDPDLAEKRLPWGHRCRCKFVSLTANQVKERNLVVVPATSLARVPDLGWN